MILNLYKMRKVVYIFLLVLLAGCAKREFSYPENIIANIPAEIPVAPEKMSFDPNNFTTRIVVDFYGNRAVVSECPKGIFTIVNGARVMMRSTLPNVEFVLRGRADEASFELYSDNSPLITFESLTLFSRQSSAVVVTSPSTVFMRGADESINYIMDGTPGVEPLNAKKASAVQINGTAVLCGGNIAVRSERKAAVQATGALLIDGVNLSVELSRADGVVADSGVLVNSGSMSISSWKDAIKSKAGNVVLLGGNMMLNGMGEKGDGVQARNILLYDGNMTVETKGAAARGLNSKGAVYIFGGKLDVRTWGDALFATKKLDYSSSACIKAETDFYMCGGNVKLNNSGVGGKGINCNGLMQIDNGQLFVRNDGADIVHSIYPDAHSSAKGIKCDSTMLIKGGKIEVLVFGKGERCEGVEAKYDMILRGDTTSLLVYAYDDAINSGKTLYVEGGNIYAYSVTNDAIDSNDAINISGGNLFACGSFTPEQGIDTDYENRYTVTGGNVIAMGGTMGPLPCLPKNRETCQPVFALGGLELVKDKYIALANNDQEVLVACRIPRVMPTAGLLMTSPELSVGDEYMLFVADSLPGATMVGNALYSGGTVAGEPYAAWEQGSIITVKQGDGSIAEIELIKDDKAKPMFPPPGEFKEGEFPFPPGEFKEGAFPPPPPGGFKDGQFPFPPGDFNGGTFPPPFAGSDSLRAVFMQRAEVEGYNADYLPWQER